MSTADEDLVYSNVSSYVDGELVPYTWRELALEREKRISALEDWRRICSDLDRCEHGRHELDVCSQCDGPSKGNPLLLRKPGHAGRADRQVGFDIGGNPIVVPERSLRNDPRNWNPRRREDKIDPPTPTEETP